MSTEYEVKIKRLLFGIDKEMWELKWQAADMEEWMHKALAEAEGGASPILDAGTQCGRELAEEGKIKRKKMTETWDRAKEQGEDDWSRGVIDYTCAVLDVACAWNEDWELASTK